VPWMLRGARRRRFLAAAGSTLAVLVTIGLGYVVNRPPVAPAAYGAIVNIGVAEGDSVPQYIADRAAALRQIAGASSSPARCFASSRWPPTRRRSSSPSPSPACR